VRAQLAEITATSSTERTQFGAERGRMLKLMQDAEAHVAV
jgi:hypothetical protein